MSSRWSLGNLAGGIPEVSGSCGVWLIIKGLLRWRLVIPRECEFISDTRNCSSCEINKSCFTVCVCVCVCVCVYICPCMCVSVLCVHVPDYICVVPFTGLNICFNITIWTWLKIYQEHTFCSLAYLTSVWAWKEIRVIKTGKNERRSSKVMIKRSHFHCGQENSNIEATAKKQNGAKLLKMIKNSLDVGCQSTTNPAKASGHLPCWQSAAAWHVSASTVPPLATERCSPCNQTIQ